MKLEKMNALEQGQDRVAELSDDEADAVVGGMLLPAIQKVRDYALVRASGGIFVASGDVDGDGRG